MRSSTSKNSHQSLFFKQALAAAVNLGPPNRALDGVRLKPLKVRKLTTDIVRRQSNAQAPDGQHQVWPASEGQDLKKYTKT